MQSSDNSSNSKPISKSHSRLFNANFIRGLTVEDSIVAENHPNQLDQQREKSSKISSDLEPLEYPVQKSEEVNFLRKF